MTISLSDNRHLGTIFNNDLDNIGIALDGRNSTPEDHQRAVQVILDAKPGVFAQNVGLPDPVIYRSEVATAFSKYNVEVSSLTWPDGNTEMATRRTDFMTQLLESGTDSLTLTIEACRKRGVLVVASYRMNSTDWYQNSYLLSDFGRAHPDCRIFLSDEEKQFSIDLGEDPPLTLAGCLDPAIAEVYEHRMEIFTEVATNYDIDGIEFDFRRGFEMISSPLQNHPVLTQMVRDTRQMLDEVASTKGRDRMLLGVRVGPSLDDPPGTEYPGGEARTDISCRQLGLDAATWIEEELVDYICPALFWPRWPGLPKTREFVDLAKEKNVGIYPTLFPLPSWLEGEAPLESDDTERLMRYKNEFCSLPLQMYDQGADGISTYNWFFHLYLAQLPNQWHLHYGYGEAGSAVQAHLLSILHDPDAIRDYMNRSC